MEKSTNWSVLNGISPMTRTMTLAHQTEVMDAHIANNNWKKMVNMGEINCNLRPFFCLTNTTHQRQPCATNGGRYVKPAWNTLRILQCSGPKWINFMKKQKH